MLMSHVMVDLMFNMWNLYLFSLFYICHLFIFNMTDNILFQKLKPPKVNYTKSFWSTFEYILFNSIESIQTSLSLNTVSLHRDMNKYKLHGLGLITFVNQVFKMKL